MNYNKIALDCDLYLSVALMTLALTLLHTFWGVVFFEGCEKKRWWVIAVVLCLHLVVSGLVRHTQKPAHACIQHIMTCFEMLLYLV